LIRKACHTFNLFHSSSFLSHFFQLVLLFLAIVSVPCMLLSKQFILKKQHEAIQKQQGQSYAPLEETDESIHNFLLRAVSNTSSYLRIWALSLAHSEISSVFYETMRRSSFSLGIQQCVDPDRWDHCFHIVGLLLVIETQSTFLHALRLHLVKFQNKFYEGDSSKFAPFSFILTGNEDD
ncbi:hypothetical protein HID58_085429, partial [Brassica napus]